VEEGRSDQRVWGEGHKEKYYKTCTTPVAGVLHVEEDVACVAINQVQARLGQEGDLSLHLENLSRRDKE
jgi:hypothetical protein